MGNWKTRANYIAKKKINNLFIKHNIIIVMTKMRTNIIHRGKKQNGKSKKKKLRKKSP
jgi:hypothetical protein